MKTMISATLMVAIFLTVASCKKNDLCNEVPCCIEQKISEIKSQNLTDPPSIWQYEYNGQTVYFIPVYYPDGYSELYDDKCNLICHPDGGFAGGGDGKCPDFFTNRTNEKLIWEAD